MSCFIELKDAEEARDVANVLLYAQMLTMTDNAKKPWLGACAARILNQVQEKADAE